MCVHGGGEVPINISPSPPLLFPLLSFPFNIGERNGTEEPWIHWSHLSSSRLGQTVFLLDYKVTLVF